MFMNSDHGDMGPDAAKLPGTGVCGNRGFIAGHPDVARRFVKSLREASDTYATAPRAKMVEIVAEWSRQDPAAIEDLYDRFNPRVGMTRVSAQVWWDILGAAMRARGEIDEKLKLEDVFDLNFVSA